MGGVERDYLLVEYKAGIYTGDAHLEEWPSTLEKLRALNFDEVRTGVGVTAIAAYTASTTTFQPTLMNTFPSPMLRLVAVSFGS